MKNPLRLEANAAFCEVNIVEECYRPSVYARTSYCIDNLKWRLRRL